MMIIPGGLGVRCPTMNDSAVVLALIQEKERAEYGEVSTTERSLRNEWQAPGFTLSTDAWVVTSYDGQIIGYARVWHYQHGVALRKLSSNGTITNDKFCLSRHVRLHLSHWRLAQRSQQNVAASLSYPSARDESTFRHRGGSNEETPMDMPPSASGADGSSAPLGYSLPVPSAMDHSSRRGVRQTGGIR